MDNNLRQVPISAIRDRASADTRHIDPSHVVALAESIGIVGLLEPIVVDSNLKLLAGAHRRAACTLVLEPDSARREDFFLKMFSRAEEASLDLLAKRVRALDRSVWGQRHPNGKVPIRIVEIDASKDSEGALRIELTENEQRRDYTKDEILGLADRLRSAGYIDRAGRPKKGEKAMRPALATIIGKSDRYLRGLMNGKGVKEAKSAHQKPPKARKVVGDWQRAIVRLRGAVTACRASGRGKTSAKAKLLLGLLVQVADAVDAVDKGVHPHPVAKT